jgi:hypothetical protein
MSRNPSSRFSSIRQSLSERFASAWVLLSETTNFLSRTNAFAQYELQLQDLRRRLREGEKDAAVIKAVKGEIVLLRGALRLQGYDLALGKLDLEVRGYRNDAAIAEGFERLVLAIGERNLYWLSGEANHLELERWLERQIIAQTPDVIHQKHYLWFRWSNSVLILSGADSENVEDFEELKRYVADKDRKLALLARLKKLW